MRLHTVRIPAASTANGSPSAAKRPALRIGCLLRSTKNTTMPVPTAANGSKKAMPSSRSSAAQARPTPQSSAHGQMRFPGVNARSAAPQSPAKQSRHSAGKILSRYTRSVYAAMLLGKNTSAASSASRCPRFCSTGANAITAANAAMHQSACPAARYGSRSAWSRASHTAKNIFLESVK